MQQKIVGVVALTLTTAITSHAAMARSDFHGNRLLDLHNNLSLAGGASYQSHSIDAGNDSRTQDGWLPSIAASASYLSPEHYVLSAGLRYSFGDQKLDDFEPDVDNDILSVNLKLGRAFLASPRVLVTPFITYGHRYWNRDLNTGRIDITGEYNSNYAGAGVNLDYQAASRLVLSAEALAGGTFASQLELESDAIAGEAEGDLDSELLAKGALKADYRFSESWHIFGGAHITYLDYGDVEYEGFDLGDAGDIYDVSLNVGLRYTY